MNDILMTIFTVYERPLDFPDQVIVRGHDLFASGGPPVAREECEAFDDLAAARKSLYLRGLSRMGREPGDEPQIVESWI